MVARLVGWLVGVRSFSGHSLGPVWQGERMEMDSFHNDMIEDRNVLLLLIKF
jgi:hypothetical protein